MVYDSEQEHRFFSPSAEMREDIAAINDRIRDTMQARWEKPTTPAPAPIVAQLPPRTEPEIRQHLVEQRELTNALLIEIKNLLTVLVEKSQAPKSEPSLEQALEQALNKLRTRSAQPSPNAAAPKMDPLF